MRISNFSVSVLLIGCAACVVFASMASDEPTSEIQDGIEVSHVGAAKLRNEEEEMRLYMIEISRQLNVTCVTCHNPKNFKEGNLAAFKTAKEHIKLTRVLMEAGMNGRDKNPKADCYMCHRGKLKPDYLEPKDALTPLKKDAKH